MKLSELVIRSMLKNMKHYYLYFFSLIFSVTLYFSFKTLRYNDEVTGQLKEGSKASSGFEVATYLLYFIILVFVLYANQIFMRRRSREIGLYQLIGMTKGLVFRLIAIENMILFSSAVLIGIGLGFLTSRLFAMILLKLIGESFVLGLTFSGEAVIATLGIFAIMLVIILIQLFILIRRQSLLEMFQAANKSDESIRKFSFFQMFMGIVGLALIIYGYKASTQLFEGAGSGLVIRMVIVLGTTILGTYFTFRYSVALLINLWRKRKNGFLSRTDIVALMPIMHRMKSSASSLTLITVLTAVSLGINTLAYITYYSIEKMAVNSIPADFVSIQDDEFQLFKSKLDDESIDYDYVSNEYYLVEVDFRQLLENEKDGDSIKYEVYSESRILPASLLGESVKGDEAIVANFSGYSTQLLDFKLGTIQLNGSNGEIDIKELRNTAILTVPATLATSPVILVSDEKFEAISQGGYHYGQFIEHHIHLASKKDYEVAEKFYDETGANVREVLPIGDVRYFMSQQGLIEAQLFSMGLTIFITAFLGLAFLLASGSILYFKQMSEADMESASYTILRKIGYAESDIMRAVYRKQLFNFGVPVLIGLFHSYFAVKSGWWFFGIEYVTPLAVMMVIYVLLYMIFALFAIRYYRAVVRRSF